MSWRLRHFTSLILLPILFSSLFSPLFSLSPSLSFLSPPLFSLSSFFFLLSPSPLPSSPCLLCLSSLPVLCYPFPSPPPSSTPLPLRSSSPFLPSPSAISVSRSLLSTVNSSQRGPISFIPPSNLSLANSREDKRESFQFHGLDRVINDCFHGVAGTTIYIEGRRWSRSFVVPSDSVDRGKGENVSPPSTSRE